MYPISFSKSFEVDKKSAHLSVILDENDNVKVSIRTFERNIAIARS